MAQNEGKEPVSLGIVTVIAGTEMALRVKPTEGISFWVPKSIIHDDSEVWKNDDEEGELFVFAWWAAKEGHA